MKRALIVGIDDYPTSPLHVCVRDARRIATLLSENGDGTHNFDCELLCSSKDLMVTRALLWQRLQFLFSQKADGALFYFSGHGSTNLLGGYLISQDGDKTNPGIAFQDLIALVQKSPIPEITLIIDCCYSGELGNVEGRYGEVAMLREGVSILTASSDTQVALTGFDGSVFTSILAHALSGEAADILGMITVASIYYHADNLLTAWDQRPMFKCHLSRMLPLRHVAPKISMALLKQICTYFPTIDHEHRLDPEYEPYKNAAHVENIRVNKDKETVFAALQAFRNVDLIEPLPPHKFMFWAAMENGGCRLTYLGKFYWKIVYKQMLNGKAASG
jgi:Caspase domain